MGEVSDSIRVYSRDEVDKRRDSLNHGIVTAFRQGRMLHAADCDLTIHYASEMRND